MISCLLRARTLSQPCDHLLHARIARDLGARYLASAQPVAADAILRSTRGILGPAADQSADLLQLEALIADFRQERSRAALLNERSLEVGQNALTPMTHAIALVNLAVAREARDPRSSASLARLALEVISSDRLHGRVESAARNVLGYVLLPLGEFETAHEELSLSISIAERSSYARVAAFARFNLAIHAELLGQRKGATEQLCALVPVAADQHFDDLCGWIRVRVCWLATQECRPCHELESLLCDAEVSVVTQPQRDALRVIRVLADLGRHEASFDELIAAALQRDDRLEAFALQLQAAAREHGVGRTRRARRLVAEAMAVARELGLRAAPNWWSREAAMVARVYGGEIAERLIAASEVGGNGPVDPRRRAIAAEDLSADVWREGRTGARVLQRLYTILDDAGPPGVDRDALCDALWPDTDGDKAVRNLYGAIDDLRRALRGTRRMAVVSEAGRYRLVSTEI